MIEELQHIMLQENQADVITLHKFSDGIYARTIVIPANVCIVGAKHLTNHLMIISQGEGHIVVNDGEPEYYCAPEMTETKVGTKRVIFAHTDTYLTTFHVTDETDLDKIGETILEPEPLNELPMWKKKLLGGVH